MIVRKNFMSAGKIALGQLSDLEPAVRQGQQKRVLDLLIGVFAIPVIIKFRSTFQGQFEAGFCQKTGFH